MRRATLQLVLLISVVCHAPYTGAAERPEQKALLGKTLSTLFNPRSAPTQRTMGLVQRSFLDLVEQSRTKLQIALVIDGTDSMSAQLEGVRESLARMMNDLELYKESNVRYQLVVFRDAGSPSGEVQLPLQASEGAFVSDRTVLLEAINRVKAESGAPYFPELVDAGLHTALTQLKWSADADTSRWILLFGDAPPFDESFQEPENKAGRRHGLGALVSLAAEKDVRVNCILCDSDPEDREAHDKVLDRTRQFMSTMSEKTGGLMLDLSYEDIRAAISKAAPSGDAQYEKVGRITKEDVEKVRQQAVAVSTPATRPLRVAVLPHLPLDRMTFDPSNEAVQLATELRLRLRALQGIEFKDSLLIRDRFRMVAEQGVQGDALLQVLATALNVDYILWGTINRGAGVVEASTALYDQSAGRRLLQAKAATNPTVPAERLGAQLAENLFKAEITPAQDARLTAAIAAVNQNPTRRNLLLIPAGLGSERSALLEGWEALDQSLALPLGEPEAAELLDSAEAALRRAVEAEKENPRERFLLASCLFNKAWAAQRRGDANAPRQLMLEFAKQLREAYRLRDSADDAALRLEIEADHALLVRGNVDDAVKRYRQLADQGTAADAQGTRRANWMLAGIASGDWGVDPKYVNHDEAKLRLIRILAYWPDSHEAEFIRRALRWDESEGGARFQHFPKENGELAELIDRSA